MEERRALKSKMEKFLSDVEQMRDSIGEKNAEIEMFEEELAKLETDKKTLEVYSYNQPELAEEKQAEIEKTEGMLKELYQEKEKEDEIKKSELESLEEPVANITEILAEIEMFEEELAKLESDKKTLEVYSYNEPELAEEKQEEIEKTEKQIEDLYEQLGKYKDIKVNFKGDISKNAIKQNEKEDINKEEKETSKMPPVVAETTKPEPTSEPIKMPPTKPEPIKVPPTKPEPVKDPPTRPEPIEMEPKQETTALKEPSKWDKFKNKCKNLWDKLKGKFGKTALAAAIGISAAGPADIAHTEKVTHQGEKIEERETTKWEEIDPNEVVENLEVGDIVTLKGDSELLYTSDFAMPMAVIENLTKSGADLKVMTTKIVDDKVHFSLVVDGNEPADLTVGGTSELLEKGELDDLPDELKAKLGTDIGWMSKDQLKDMIQPTMREVKTTEQVKVPYEYTTDETVYTHMSKPDAKQVETPEQPTKEELKTQEPYKPNGYKDLEDLENGEDVEIGNGIKISLAKDDEKNKTSRSAKAREASKDKGLDELIDEYVKENKFRDSIKIDNKDNKIERNATKIIEADIMEHGKVVGKTEVKQKEDTSER